eukprot:TRINITY_DN60550_c0_g1_i1.p1 TRINITY_DN60550_c0_g1~~TRINITY_DN60550_c0_g1_i1.p1  ORF type:complete len:442 (+),score=87.17 TRINITY_DN60550_c0_g1_i1:119-1444(+)
MALLDHQSLAPAADDDGEYVHEDDSEEEEMRLLELRAANDPELDAALSARAVDAFAYFMVGQAVDDAMMEAVSPLTAMTPTQQVYTLTPGSPWARGISPDSASVTGYQTVHEQDDYELNVESNDVLPLRSANHDAMAWEFDQEDSQGEENILFQEEQGGLTGSIHDESCSFGDELPLSDDEDRRTEDGFEPAYPRRELLTGEAIEEDVDSLPIRPAGPEGRPQTRGLRGALLSQPPVAPDFPGASRGTGTAAGAPRASRKVIYIDHHHVHHHHHFHEPSDWSGSGASGDLPPELQRRRQERKAEADVEERAAPKNVGHPSVEGSGALALGNRLAASQKHGLRNGRSRPRRRGNQKGAGSVAPSTASTTISGLSSFNTTGSSMAFADSKSQRMSKPLPSIEKAVSGKDPGELSLQQYFKLYERLPLGSRLKLSPYGAPLSAR